MTVTKGGVSADEFVNLLFRSTQLSALRGTAKN